MLSMSAPRKPPKSGIYYSGGGVPNDLGPSTTAKDLGIGRTGVYRGLGEQQASSPASVSHRHHQVLWVAFLCRRLMPV